MTSVTTDPKILVALDFDQLDQALNLAKQLDPKDCRLKVGKELFTLFGPKVVESLQKLGFELFLDLKFHDIPATVAKAVRAAAQLGVWMVNVHASGGQRMMASARDAISSYAKPPLLIGVTVLTSMDQSDLDQIGVHNSVTDQVLHLAKLTQDSGLDGVVCSAAEAPLLRAQLGRDFVLVTPGIRLPGDSADDQRRIVTPELAVNAGSHYLVIGRSITQSPDPAATCRKIAAALADPAR